MRNHIQGVVLLLILAAALWASSKLAVPALSDAFGDNGAVVAESNEDVVDLSTGSESVQPETPLTPEDVFTIQWHLALGGFLEAEDIDGILGKDTRNAMTAAKAAFGIPLASDRNLMAHLLELAAAADIAEPVSAE